jgi:hypothetical protein
MDVRSARATSPFLLELTSFEWAPSRANAPRYGSLQLGQTRRTKKIKRNEKLAAGLSSVALQGLEALDAELPVMLGGVEYDAGRPAEGPGPARGTGVEHPGLRIAIRTLTAYAVDCDRLIPRALRQLPSAP